MRQFALTIILLILANSIHADGIISNLDQYLKMHPDRIDAQGWVTIPRSELLENNKYFDADCDYKLIHSDTSTALPVEVSKLSFVFKTSGGGNYLHRVLNDNKTKIWACPDGNIKKRSNSALQVTAFKQSSPESLRYISNTRLKNCLKNSELIDLLVKMGKRIKDLEKRKTCCDNCTIL